MEKPYLDFTVSQFNFFTNTIRDFINEKTNNGEIPFENNEENLYEGFEYFIEKVKCNPEKAINDDFMKFLLFKGYAIFIQVVSESIKETNEFLGIEKPIVERVLN